MDLYITLDYELFLGLMPGTPENCLVKPMDALNKVAEAYNIKYIIFVDAAYLLRLQELQREHPQLKRDFDLVCSHIKYLHDFGHDIQLHFHPQWLYSEYNSKSSDWIMDMKHYKLSDMERTFAFRSFKEAKSLLDGIIGSSTYAFRAGGYCLDTFDNYGKLFEDNGICIDSSVARYMYTNSPLHKYDYRKIPRKHIYRFQNSIHTENQDGRFIELSISDCKWNAFFYFTKIRNLMSYYHPSVVYKDGISVDTVKYSKITILKKFFHPYHNLICIDGIRSCQLEPAYKQACNRGYDNLVIIGHPKAASDDSIGNLEQFLRNNIQNLVCKTTRNILG